MKVVLPLFILNLNGHLVSGNTKIAVIIRKFQKKFAIKNQQLNVIQFQLSLGQSDLPFNIFFCRRLSISFIIFAGQPKTKNPAHCGTKKNIITIKPYTASLNEENVKSLIFIGGIK